MYRFELLNVINALNIKQVNCFNSLSYITRIHNRPTIRKTTLPANHLLLKITVPLCPWTWISVLEQGSWQGAAHPSPWSPAAASIQRLACLCFPFASSSLNSPQGI